MDRTAALIVAAGRGVRAGGTLPKQFVALGGVTVIARAVDAFAGMPVFVVVGEGQRELLDALLEHGARYVMIEGKDWEERFAQAVAAVERYIFRR